MATLIIKLVESLSKDRYLREDKIDISGLSDPEQDKILDTIRDSNDIGEINQVADKLKVPDDLKAPIVRSIIKYRSIYEKANPIVQIYNAFNGENITGDQLFTFYNVLNKVPMTHSNIAKYFNPATDILASKDLNYLVTLVAHLSDKYTAKKYKNDIGDIPSIDQHLMDGGKFKATDVIKRLMDTFTTDNDSQTISLKKWFEDQKISEYKKFISDKLQDTSVSKNLSEDTEKNSQLFVNKLDTIFTDKKDMNAMLNNVDVPQSLSKDSAIDVAKLLDLIFSYLKGDEDQIRAGSVSDVLDKAGYKTLSEKFDGLKKSIDNMNIDKVEKLSAKAKLDLLAYSKNKTLTDKLFDAQVPDGDINKLPKIIFAFLKQAVKQNYLYTTIREALALKGKQSAQGHKFLAHYLLNMNSDAKKGYLDRFDKVWNNKKLQHQLLNARITRTASGAFNWVKAITDFLNDIKI